MIKICREQGIDITEKESGSHLIHEILEVAVNICISKINEGEFEEKDKSISDKLGELNKIEKQIPTQSWRGRTN